MTLPRAIQLNGTGVTQTGPDFPLYLHTENTEGNLATSGVRLSGTYKFGVGDINVMDDASAGAGADSDVARSPRRITSAGTVRISTFDAGHSQNEIPDYGTGTGNDAASYPEVSTPSHLNIPKNPQKNDKREWRILLIVSPYILTPTH